MTRQEAERALAALFNAGKSIGNARLQYDPNEIMTEDEASDLLGHYGFYADYVRGRPIKVDFQDYSRLSLLQIDTTLHDRDYGKGHFARITKGIEE